MARSRAFPFAEDDSDVRRRAVTAARAHRPSHVPRARVGALAGDSRTGRRVRLLGGRAAEAGLHAGHELGGAHGRAQPRQRVHNSDSRLDSALLKGHAHGTTSATRTATSGAESTAYHRFDPALPPASTSGRVPLHWHAREAPVRVSADTVVAGWTFEGDIPGPIVHCRVGDTVEFTLTNDADIPHSMDFHAAQLDPKVAFRSVPKGQSVTFTFKPKYAGAFMYHCGTAPVLMSNT